MFTVEKVVRKFSAGLGVRIVTVFVAGTDSRYGFQFRCDTQDCIGWWEPRNSEAERVARKVAFE